MNCPRCNTQNPDGSTFCNKCGLRLPLPMQNQNYQQLQQNQQTNQYQYENPNVRYRMNMQNKPSKIPFYKKTWFIVLMCIFFPPVGIVFMWVGKKPANKVARILLTIFLCLWTLLSVISKSVDYESTNSEEKAGVEKNKEETEEDNGIYDKENEFLTDLKAVAGDDVASGAYDVLTNQIGFSKLKYEEKLGETSNYGIFADETYMVITATSDYYRVFIPNTSYVFYEEGNVLMTAKEFNDSKISSKDMPYYYRIAQIIIEENLKSPKSADFPWSDEISYQKKNNLVAISGYVDAENSFGAEIRSNYIVQFYVYDLENLSYETTYIEIDGEKAGEFINMD